MAARKEEAMTDNMHPSVSAYATQHMRTRSNSNVTPEDVKPNLMPRHSRKHSGLLDGKLSMRKSSVTENMVKIVEDSLTDEELNEADHKMINQFLRATKLDVDRAVKRLKATIAWRIQEQPHRRVGFTKLDQPIIYSCFAMARDRDIMANREHMLTTFEQAIRAMPPHVEQWVWLADYHGFGLKDCDPRLARMFLDISEKHYPERLAMFVNISTPSIFPMFFKAIENWIDPYTRSKIKFLKCRNVWNSFLHTKVMCSFNAKKESKQNLHLREELGKLVEPDMLEWLIDEMAQNRTKIAIKQKDYPYGKRFPGAGISEQVKFEGHDCRGHEDIITIVESNPSILVPNT